MFWEHGYEGVDVDRIARAPPMNVTKPALYRAFGDKSTLLLKAVERYAPSIVWSYPKWQLFKRRPDIHKAVTAFCEATVNTATGDARFGGCMMAAAALGHVGAGNEDPLLARPAPCRIQTL